jgi:hypothetical protein
MQFRGDSPVKIQRLAVGFALSLGACSSALAVVYQIDNPATQINNPASKMYNPASKENNPASNIYNPASRMNNPNPLSPVTQPVPQPENKKPQAKKSAHPPQAKPAVPRKSYHFKTANLYLKAAKKAFIYDDYREFIMITEDALRRITAGTLKASDKELKKLEKFQAFGYGLLEKSEK